MAATATGETLLGTVVCKYCNHILEMVDTEKVTVIYVSCERENCKAIREKVGENVHEC
ncbi:MAG TPA: GapA-binding peptide SR1P [Bacilli bacterium]